MKFFHFQFHEAHHEHVYPEMRMFTYVRKGFNSNQKTVKVHTVPAFLLNHCISLFV